MSKSVVLIDDSDFQLEQLVWFFTEKMGYKVLATGNDGNDAVKYYRKYQPDLLTLDITMPNKDGKTTLNELSMEFPDINVLIISALKGNTMLECMKLGAKGYIEKPLKFANEDFVEDFKLTLSEIFEEE
ncbi:MAG: response regulator [Fibrobacterales bacterium]